MLLIISALGLLLLLALAGLGLVVLWPGVRSAWLASWYAGGRDCPECERLRAECERLRCERDQAVGRTRLVIGQIAEMERLVSGEDAA
jgi:hypothetical protein